MGDRVLRALAAFCAELLVTGVWACFDPQFVADNARWFVTIGLIGLIAAWFSTRIRRYLEWEKLGAPSEALSQPPTFQRDTLTHDCDVEQRLPAKVVSSPADEDFQAPPPAEPTNPPLLVLQSKCEMLEERTLNLKSAAEMMEGGCEEYRRVFEQALAGDLLGKREVEIANTLDMALMSFQNGQQALYDTSHRDDYAPSPGSFDLNLQPITAIPTAELGKDGEVLRKFQIDRNSGFIGALMSNSAKLQQAAYDARKIAAQCEADLNVLRKQVRDEKQRIANEPGQ